MVKMLVCEDAETHDDMLFNEELSFSYRNLSPIAQGNLLIRLIALGGAF